MINNKSLNKDVLSNQTLSNRRKAMEIILSGGHTENKAIKNIVECVNQQTFAYNTIQEKILESTITFDKIYEMLNTYGRCAIIVIFANILKNNLDYVIVEKNGQEQKISASLLENIEKSPEEYTLTVVKNKYEYEKYKCIFDVNTVDTNIFFSIVGRMQSWFFGLCKYVNVIENQYVGKGKYESLSKEVVNLKNSLRGIIQNPYWYIEDKLKSIFTGDISEKLKAVKYDIDNTMINLQNSLKTDVDYIFPETLQGWYEKLPSNAKIRIYKNGEEKFLDICKDSENNIQLIDILAFYLTGLSIENWSENTPSTFYEQLICRGADINNSIKMTSYINNINQTNLLLNENFRSDFAIIDKVNSIFTHDFKYKEKTLHFDKTLLLKPDIADKSCENAVYFSSYSNVVDTIHDLIENQKIQGKNINYGDITILCRKNYMVDNIGEILKNAGIPVEVIGGRGFYRAKEIIDIGKFLNYIVYRRLEYKKELFLTDIYKAFIDTGGTDFDKFLNNLTVIAKSESIESVLSYIIDTSKLTQYYDKKGYYQANANLSKLRDMASDGPNNSFMPSIQFLDFITRRIISLAEEDEAPISDDNRKNGVVSVYTVHKAKGLSFPIVIIAGMDEDLINPKHFPMVIINQNNNQINISFKEEVFKSQIKDIEYEKSIENYITDLLEEELRIFYVACTRAKHMLLFSSCKNNNFNNNCVTWTKWLYESKNHHT